MKKKHKIMFKDIRHKMAVLLLIGTLAFQMTGCISNQENVDPATTEYTVATVPAATEREQVIETSGQEVMLTIETQFAVLQFPLEYSEYLRHKEITDPQVTAEIFSMFYQNTETELFRIYFGGEPTGDQLGAFDTENGELPIYISVCEYPDGYFSDAETFEIYCFMMESMETVISAIWDNDQFIDINKIEIQEEDKKTVYWEFSLPENMRLEETQNESYYLADFYGTVNNQTYKLYSVALGEPTLESPLGVYQTAKGQRVFSAESYDLPEMANWSEQDIAELYTMMGSINEVIQTIMSDTHFLAEMPE